MKNDVQPSLEFRREKGGGTTSDNVSETYLLSLFSKENVNSMKYSDQYSPDSENTKASNVTGIKMQKKDMNEVENYSVDSQ